MNNDTLRKIELLKDEFRIRKGMAGSSEEILCFIKDALREKRYKGQTIYKIDIYAIDKETSENNEEYAKTNFVPISWKWRRIEDIERYPFSPLSLFKSIYTIDYQFIEQLVGKEINRKDALNMIQYIFVTQLPCDKSSTVKEPYCGFPRYNYISMCSYDYKGQLVDTTVTSSPGFGKLSKYYGRQKSQIRFNVGDIVEVANLYRGKPGVIIGRVKEVPLDIVDMYFKRNIVCNYYLEDSYRITIIDPETRKLKDMSVPSINVFYPRFPIPKAVLAELNQG